MSCKFQIGDERPWEPAGLGIKRQVMGYDGRLMLVKVAFEQGAVGTLHTHAHSQASYVVSGCFELSVNNEKRVLRPGDGFYVEPDAPHECLCLEAGLLIDAFSPARLDFINDNKE
ncbi:MAG: cupin domain-containing protein [Tannerellaceae bacterium]|nr:cupin domain-containing protein [Tannerellaceae bacterium]